MTEIYITKLPKLCRAIKGVDTSLKGACLFWRNIKNATVIRKIVFDNVVKKFEDSQLGAARLFICTSPKYQSGD
jgi:predicted DNA-binding ribbon-helix-helix protein